MIAIVLLCCMPFRPKPESNKIKYVRSLALHAAFTIPAIFLQWNCMYFVEVNCLLVVPTMIVYCYRLPVEKVHFRYVARSHDTGTAIQKRCSFHLHIGFVVVVFKYAYNNHINQLRLWYEMIIDGFFDVIIATGDTGCSAKYSSSAPSDKKLLWCSGLP